MKEQTLIDYFDGKATVDTLSAELNESQQITRYNSTTVFIDHSNNDGEYQVTRKHLLKLCDDTLNGGLTPIDLNRIASVLIASDYFTWDSGSENGDIVSTTIFDWDNPDINFDLTGENLKLWKKYLESGEYKLERD